MLELVGSLSPNFSDAQPAAPVALAPGQVVEVQEKSGNRVEGRVESSTATHIGLLPEREPARSIPWSDVRRVLSIRRERRDSVFNGVLFGAAGGAAYAGAVVAGQSSTSDAQGTGATVRAVALGAAMGAGVGVIVDLIRRRPERRVIYTAR